MSASQAMVNSSNKKPRWYAPSIAKFLAMIVVSQAILYLSLHYHWFWFNDHKGHTVLVAVAVTLALLLLLLAWVAMGRLLGAKPQFSLATLLLIVAVVGIPCSWLAREIEMAQRQRAVLEVLTADEGGLLIRQVIIALGRRNNELQSPVLGWLRQRFGDEFFDKQTSLRVTKVTDDVFAMVSKLPELEELDIEDNSTIDEELIHFRRHPQLQTIRITNSRVTKTGISHLQRIPELRKLVFIRSRLDDVELEQIGKLPQLKVLRIAATTVSDDGLKHLPGLKKLESLSLVNIEITDAGLEHLEGFTNLTSLSLGGNKITDAGLKHLEGLNRLKLLALNETWTSRAGVEALKRALPNCEIQSDALMTYGQLLNDQP